MHAAVLLKCSFNFFPVDLQPPTPKRLLSPFRRHNRVSPFTPGGREKLSNSRPKQAGSHVQLQVVTKATSPLSGSETSLVKDRDSAEQDPSWQSHSSGATQDRPKSAPSTKQNALTSSPLAQAITAKGLCLFCVQDYYTHVSVCTFVSVAFCIKVK